MIDDVLKDAGRRMDKTVEATKHEFTTIRTGRASAALLERVQVAAYGTKMPINQLATISVPEPRLLTITPFDKSIMKDIEKGRIVIFAAGTGNPFFTTDTAAALRALEIGAEAILMGKNGVEGVLDADPRTTPDARLIPQLTHLEAIERGLRVMDTTALSLCMDNRLPLHVFNLDDESNIERVVRGERIGTVIQAQVPAEVAR